MLIFRCKDLSGNTLTLNHPLCLNITEEEDVPADAVSALFENVQCPELCTFEIFSDNEKVFSGVIDEQERIISAKGVFLKLSGRSMAALLLDNESVPVTYDHPSSGLIYERHVKPYGITTRYTPDSTYFSELTVTKGESNWQALNRFCQKCLSTAPRISAAGELFFEGLVCGREILFSDTDGDILYSAIEERVRRCEEISAVNIKVTNSAGYHRRIVNSDALARGIVRERYLNAVLTDTPMNRADRMIRQGREKGYRIKLCCEGRYLDLPGVEATVKDSVIGEKTGLYVSALYYRLSPKGETTELILKRRDV